MFSAQDVNECVKFGEVRQERHKVSVQTVAEGERREGVRCMRARGQFTRCEFTHSRHSANWCTIQPSSGNIESATKLREPKNSQPKQHTDHRRATNPLSTLVSLSLVSFIVQCEPLNAKHAKDSRGRAGLFLLRIVAYNRSQWPEKLSVTREPRV